jgi:hypothetical protein
MAKARPKPPPLPPPPQAACWAEFAKWTLGIPLLVAVALGIVWIAIWITGSGEMMWQTTRDMGTVLMWLALIVLMYPAMMFVWVSDLRSGLRAAKEWAALTEAEQATAIAAQASAVPARRRRKKG